MPTKEYGRLTIIELRADDFKILRSVHITPTSSLVRIEGKNGQGKSSTLDAIESALSSKRFPGDPIRHGAEEGTTQLLLGERKGDDGKPEPKFLVTRTFSQDGKNKLTITDPSGKMKFPGPQTMLDAFFGDFTFDPLAFMRLNPKDQLETLLKLIGIDFDKLYQRRKSAYDDRTILGRELKMVKGAVDSTDTKQFKGLPAERLDPEVLKKQLDDARAVEHRNQQHQNAINTKKAQLEQMNNSIAEAEKRLRQARQQASDLESDIQHMEQEPQEGGADIEELTTQYQEIQSINARIAERERFKEYEKELKLKTESIQELSDRIDDIDKAKRDAIVEAQLPVSNLNMTDEFITYQDIPLSDCASSVQLRVSAAIGAALSPQLAVMLIREGSLLDSEGMLLLEDFAVKNKLQIWCERVNDGKGGMGVILLEDGMVKE